MASIQSRKTAGGKERHVVLYRHKGKQTSLTFLKARDATKARDLINALGPDEALVRIRGIQHTGDAPTVAEWLEKHISDLTGVTDRTRKDYRRLARLHVVPTLGALDVDEVKPADISRWSNRLEKDGSSAKSIANLRALLSAAFGYAVDEGLRDDNPMRRLRRSRAGEHDRTDMVCLTPQEFTHLRSMVRDRWRTFVTVLAGTGMRFGEAVALEVGDVDLLAPTPVIRITKALKRAPHGFEVGPPKTRKSRRTISLPAELVNLLAPWVMRDPSETLFVGRDGARVSHSNFYGRIWRPATLQFEKETGRRPRIHDLRHSHVAWLIAAGVPLPVIQDRLGHESITTTVDTYGHLLPDQHRITAAALDGLLADEKV